MTHRLAAVVFGFSVLGCAQEKAPKQSFEVTETERVSFLAGGTVEVNNSYGYLTVEGWDEPEVEVTVAKSTDRFYEPERREQAGQRFDEIRVSTALGQGVGDFDNSPRPH
jgi:hypothetical protein